MQTPKPQAEREAERVAREQLRRADGNHQRAACKTALWATEMHAKATARADEGDHHESAVALRDAKVMDRAGDILVAGKPPA